MKTPAWDEDSERRQAEDFTIRAEAMENVGRPGTAELFKDLADLSRKKADTIKIVETTTREITAHLQATKAG